MEPLNIIIFFSLAIPVYEFGLASQTPPHMNKSWELVLEQHIESSHVWTVKLKQSYSNARAETNLSNFSSSCLISALPGNSCPALMRYVRDLSNSLSCMYACNEWVQG